MMEEVMVVMQLHDILEVAAVVLVQWVKPHNQLI